MNPEVTVDNVLDRLTLDRPYRTGPQAWTDLHAGGLFFCVIYRECLQFGEKGIVRRWCEILDDAREFDDESDKLRGADSLGSYELNDRGYLVCKFSDLELTGLPSQLVNDVLAFHAWQRGRESLFGVAYTRDPSQT